MNDCLFILSAPKQPQWLYFDETATQQPPGSENRQQNRILVQIKYGKHCGRGLQTSFSFAKLQNIRLRPSRGTRPQPPPSLRARRALYMRAFMTSVVFSFFRPHFKDIPAGGISAEFEQPQKKKKKKRSPPWRGSRYNALTPGRPR